MSQNDDFQALYTKATEAASKAAHEADAKLPPESQRGFDCGFAWVVIRPATQPFVRWCKKQGHGSLAYGGGWQIWNPSGHNTQSIGPKETGAEAFAEVLRKGGINGVTTGSRLD